MKLAAFAILLTAPAALAETSLAEYGPNVSPQPSTQITETACTVDVQLHGAVATVEQRQTLSGDGRLAARYLFDLPAGATITSFGAAGQQGLVVPGAFSNATTDDRPMFGADPALLVARPEGSSSQYAITVQPARSIELVTKYTALADVRMGALRLVLPARTGGRLTACRGTLRASGGPGASISEINVDGAVTKGARATFIVGDRPVTLDAALAFTGKAPVAWTQSQPLSDGLTATVLTVAAPRMRAALLPSRRALFLIDGSRSMELVGRAHVTTVLHAIAGALPAGTPLDAIVYDRTATRVFGAWKPSAPDAIAAIDKALAAHAPTNGSDLAQALATARGTLGDGGRDATLVVVISDGVLGASDGRALVGALAGTASHVDVLGVVLDPARTRSPGAEAVRAPAIAYGGAFVEIDVEHVDAAIDAVDSWLRPSWLGLASEGGLAVPDSIRAGGGFTRVVAHRGAPSKFVLRATGASTLRLVPRALPAAPVATLALADADLAEDIGAMVRARVLAQRPYVHDRLALAVLTTDGKVARNRAAMVAGGGPYERVTAVRDPDETAPYVAPPARLSSAVERETLERLFRDQLQPKAYLCYQRAIAAQPKLAGTVHFTLYVGRGEISDVSIVGLGDPQLDACLTDAAYAMSVPFPDFAVNADDQTIARYPLTFHIADRKPIIILGDADSTSPIDVEHTPGELPESARRKVRVDASTPLGTMKPSSP